MEKQDPVRVIGYGKEPNWLFLKGGTALEDIVRVGMVSSVENGMVRVYYPDREETTASLHLFAGNGEYSLPQVNDQVIVLHLSNDTSTAVVLGSFWSEADPVPKDTEFYKNIGKNAFISFKDSCCMIHAPEIRLESTSGSITLTEIIYFLSLESG